MSIHLPSLLVALVVTNEGVVTDAKMTSDDLEVCRHFTKKYLTRKLEAVYPELKSLKLHCRDLDWKILPEDRFEASFRMDVALKFSSGQTVTPPADQVFGEALEDWFGDEYVKYLQEHCAEKSSFVASTIEARVELLPATNTITSPMTTKSQSAPSTPKRHATGRRSTRNAQQRSPYVQHIADIFVCFSIPGLEGEPTAEEREKMTEITLDFYSDVLLDKYTECLYKVAVVCTKTDINAGIPEEHFNFYIEWDVSAAFKDGPTAPSHRSFCKVLVDDIDIFGYLKDRVRSLHGTPFQNACAVYTEQVNSLSDG